MGFLFIRKGGDPDLPVGGVGTQVQPGIRRVGQQLQVLVLTPGVRVQVPPRAHIKLP